ncbi:MAG: sugar phosphate isomerase/epimerase, partial [bacterium]|nr:sugar phosphate isomerase/epimerase [bacterium]
DVNVTAFWAGWSGPKVWNFLEGPETLGIVPDTYREMRVQCLKNAGSFAKKVGLTAIVTHLGFLPENPSDPKFEAVCEAVKDVADYLEALGVEFWFETGQETPVTLYRLIKTLGNPNLGINLDPANLILYGKANPIDALDIFGSFVKNVHAKDAVYPTDPMKLGTEVKVGAGKVRFPAFVKRLNEIGFSGEYIIEREISGAEQIGDIQETILYLESL